LNLRFSLTPHVVGRYATYNHRPSKLRAQAEELPAHYYDPLSKSVGDSAMPRRSQSGTATITPKTGNYPLSPPPNHANTYTTLGSSPSPYDPNSEVSNMVYAHGAGSSKALFFSPTEVLA
jgi:hypothetical protein